MKSSKTALQPYNTQTHKYTPSNRPQGWELSEPPLTLKNRLIGRAQESGKDKTHPLKLSWDGTTRTPNLFSEEPEETPFIHLRLWLTEQDSSPPYHNIYLPAKAVASTLCPPLNSLLRLTVKTSQWCHDYLKTKASFSFVPSLCLKQGEQYMVWGWRDVKIIEPLFQKGNSLAMRREWDEQQRVDRVQIRGSEETEKQMGR